jgi:hypothetical protein
MKTDRVNARGLPFLDYEYHIVEFIEPDQNLRIFHALYPESADQVGYLVLNNDGGGVVYDPRRDDPTSKWNRDSIVLRTNRAPATVLLLLVVWKRGSTS